MYLLYVHGLVRFKCLDKNSSIYTNEYIARQEKQVFIKPAEKTGGPPQTKIDEIARRLWHVKK